MKNKKRAKVVEKNSKVEFIKEHLPVSFVIVLMIVWFYIVITNYYKHNVFSFSIITDYFSLQEFRTNLSFKNILFIVSHLSTIFFASLIFFAAYGIGKKILKIFNLGKISFLESTLFSISFGLGVIFVLLFIVGITGFLYKSVVLGIVIFLGIYSFFDTIKNKESIKITLPNFSFGEKLWLFLCIVICIVVIIGCLSPEIFYDSLVYHLAKPNNWIQHHKIIPNKTMVVADFYPGNANLLFVIGLFFKDETVCKMISLIFNILTFFTLYAMGKRFFNYKVGFLSAVFFFTIPYVGILSYRSAVEMPLAFFETLMVFSFILWILTEENRWLVISAINCGLGVGVKYTTFYGLTGIVVAIITKGIVEKKSLRLIIEKIVMFSAISVIMVLPWFLYNYFYTGNPVYPYFSKFIGFLKPRSKYDPTSNLYTFHQWGKDFVNLIKSPWIVSMGLSEEAFIGIILLLFVPLFFLCKSKWKPTKYLFVYVVIYMVIWNFNHKLYVRYFIPAIATISFLISLYLNEINFNSFLKKSIYLVITFLIVNNLSFVMKIQKFSNNCFGVVCGLQSKYEYLNCLRPTYPGPYYSVAEWINKNLSKDVIVYMLGEYRSYYIDRKVVMTDFSSWSPLALWCNEVKDEEELYNKFIKEGVTHILFNVPEVRRLAGFDDLYFENNGYEIWLKFWNKYVREIYRGVADISIPQQGILSMKNQQPQWWQQYVSDIHNYVYLYEIIPKHEIGQPHQVPYNFFLEKEIYSSDRWQKISSSVEKFLNSKNKI